MWELRLFGNGYNIFSLLQKYLYFEDMVIFAKKIKIG
jgi:hypothetical protein